MSIEIKVPSLGESITEATVSKWMKKEGESEVDGERMTRRPSITTKNLSEVEEAKSRKDR